MDMITVTAKTVDEAVTKALIELETTKIGRASCRERV